MRELSRTICKFNNMHLLILIDFTNFSLIALVEMAESTNLYATYCRVYEITKPFKSLSCKNINYF